MAAGKLVALTILGLMFTAGVAAADLLPPLPPPPQIPSFPQPPTVPVPGIPVEGQACVAMLNGAGSGISAAIANGEAQGIGAFGHQSAESQALVSESTDSLALGDLPTQYQAMVQQAAAIETGALGGSKAATDSGLAGANKAFNATFDASNLTYTHLNNGVWATNTTFLNWANATEHRFYDAAYPVFVNGTYNNATNTARLTNHTLRMVAYVNGGDPVPATSVYGLQAQALADAGAIAASAYGYPVAAGSASEGLAGTASAAQHGAVAMLGGGGLPGTGDLSAPLQAHSGSMTSLAQADAAALQGTLSASAGSASGWALAVPAAAPGCAHVSL